MSPRAIMQSTRRRRSRPSTKRLSLPTIIIVALILGFILFNKHGFWRLARLRREQAQLREQIVELHVRADSLRTDVNSLETDMAYIEQLAREKYRMVKRGEKVFRVIRNDQEARVQPKK